MDSKLNDDEINALQSLDPYSSSDGARIRAGDLPHRLFAFNLVARQPSGAIVLTKHGERALFRHACVSHLEALSRGEALGLTNGVERWLRSNGFIDGASAQGDPAITPRGRLWLASFQKDAPVEIPELTASDFAVRRACSEA